MRSLSPARHSPERDWRLLSAATFLFSFGFAVYTAVFLNDITEVLKVQPIQMGLLESLREIPGLLSVAIAAIVAAHAETRIGAICLCLSALGVAATGFVHSFTELVLVTVFWSVFMHQWFTSSSAIPLALSGGQDSGRHLGRLGGIGAAGTVLAFLIVRPLAGRVPYPAFFLGAGLVIFLGGLTLLLMSSASATVGRPRLLYRREYRLYYLLRTYAVGASVMVGCRRYRRMASRMRLVLAA